jgi:hypothetical protein
VDRKPASSLANENTISASRYLTSQVTPKLLAASAPLNSEEVVIDAAFNVPLPSDQPVVAPAIITPPLPPPPTGNLDISSIAGSSVINATASGSRRSTRPARVAVNLASSATSEAVKPSKTASREKKNAPVASASKVVAFDVESITKLHTARNEVVFSAITTVKQRRQGARPRGDPLTVAEKIAALSREDRALRRQ